MRKYRLTKITVKTREILLLSKNAADEIHTSVCPQCHTPLSALIPAAESSAVTPDTEKRPAELSPPELATDEISN